MRETVADVLLERHEDKWKETILSFLKDDNEAVRKRVIDGIIEANWPDTLKICQDYIKQNQPEASHKGSVLSARRIANPEDKKRAGALDADKPHALQRLVAYIAQHKGDPDYEYSVSIADNHRQHIQNDLDFYETQGTYEKSQAGIKKSPAVLAKFG